MLSIDEFAKKCKVSKSTVSRAFRDNSTINQETKNYILKKAKELNYKPKAYTKRVQSIARSSMIGIMIGIKAYPYANDLCMAISDVIESAGYVPVIFNNQNGDMAEVKALDAAKNILSGLIIVPATTQNDYNSKFIKQISKKMPVICIVRKLNDINLDSITIKNYSGLLNATRLLLDHDHKNIGFFAGPMNISPSHDKLTGYTDALNRYNVPVNGDYIVYGEHDIKKTAAQVKELLYKHPEITALITSNIIMSRGVLLGLEQMHLSVPENIALVSYGNDTLFSVGKNKVSCIYDYHYDLGVQAANMMLRRINEFKINKRYEPEQITIYPELIIRGSEVYPTKPIISL